MTDMLQASAFGDRGKRYDAESLDAESAMALTELSRGGLVEGSMHAGFTITPEGLADMMCKNVLHAPKYMLHARTGVPDDDLSTFELLDRLHCAGWRPRVLAIGERKNKLG